MLLWLLFACGLTTIVSQVTSTVDPTQNRHPISNFVYGANFADASNLASVHYPVNRNGGNAASLYNWEYNLHNTGSDWFFLNEVDPTAPGAKLPDGSAVDVFAATTKAAGSKWLLTANLMGYVPQDVREKKWSYSVKKYGAQQATECTATHNASWCQPDAGNGVLLNGTKITAVVWPNAYKTIDTSYNVEQLSHLSGNNLFPDFVALDNEPMLWDSTHRDTHPTPLGLDELWAKTKGASSAMKAKYPQLVTSGPAVWGWCAYFYSAIDGCAPGKDRAAHNNTDLLNWYAQQVCEYQKSNGVALVDYLDIHYYPQAANVDSSNEDPQTIIDRFNAPKSLYNSGYIDNSWISKVNGNQPIDLVPRMKKIIADSCPSMKFSVTEWNFGNDDIWSGATASAEVLALWGREGVDLATIWTVPGVGSIGENAFKLYLNYDGKHSNVFGDSISATTSTLDVPVYAIASTEEAKWFVIVINKRDTSQTVDITLANMQPSSNQASRFAFGKSIGPISARTPVPIASNSLKVTLTPWEVTLLVIQ